MRADLVSHGLAVARGPAHCQVLPEDLRGNLLSHARRAELLEVDILFSLGILGCVAAVSVRAHPRLRLSRIF